MKNDYCSNTFDWQKLPYSLYIFPAENKMSSGDLYIDDYKTFAYRSKKYVLYRFTFDPLKQSIIYEKFGDSEIALINKSKITRIVIIRNEFMTWSGYNKVSHLGNSLEQCKILHFEDRLEVLHLDLCLNKLNSGTLSFQ